MSLLTMIIISISLLICLVVGIFIEDYDDLKGLLIIIGFVGLLLFGVGGFGVYATSSKHSMMYEEMYPDKILKSDIKLYVELGEITLTFSSKKDYETINDSTIFYKVTYYNHYNYDNGVEYLSDQEFKELDYDEKYIKKLN